MEMTSLPTTRTVAAVALALGVAVAVTACASTHPLAGHQAASARAATPAGTPGAAAASGTAASSATARTSTAAGGGPAEDTPELTYLQYARALARSDYADACSELSEPAQRDFGHEAGPGGGTCEQALSSHNAEVASADASLAAELVALYGKLSVVGTGPASLSEGVCAACSGDVSLRVAVPATNVPGDAEPARTVYVPLVREAGRWKVDLNQPQLGQTN
jgi:hypothetical protein